MLKKALIIVLALTMLMNVAALAINDNPKGATVPEVSEGETMDTNYGIIVENNGTVNHNVQENKSLDGEGIITTNNGTVNTNDGIITGNTGTVTTNNGTISDNNGTITTNSGIVTTNDGTVTTNGGIVTTNDGTVTTNDGTVSYNKDTIIDNVNTVTENQALIQSNSGTVDTNVGTISTNDGTVDVNNGEIINNLDSVNANNKTIQYNEGTVSLNSSSGTILENDDVVVNNAGAIGTNFGDVQSNTGSITVNYENAVNEGGTIEQNEGYVKYYSGKVENNYGTVEDVSDPGIAHLPVENNYGVVISNYPDAEKLYWVSVLYETNLGRHIDADAEKDVDWVVDTGDNSDLTDGYTLGQTITIYGETFKKSGYKQVYWVNTNGERINFGDEIVLSEDNWDTFTLSAIFEKVAKKKTKSAYKTYGIVKDADNEAQFVWDSSAAEKQPLEFVVEAPIEKFRDVKVGDIGKKVRDLDILDEQYYTVEEDADGNTVVRLSVEYLETVTEAQRIVFRFDGGAAYGEFEIK